MKLKIYFLSFMLLSLCLNTYSQVTIGSSEKPVGGALLDLKQNDAPNGGITATKGLGLPRVELKDLKALTMGDNEIANSSNEWQEHTGLVVYNTNKCVDYTGEANGPYAWDGAEWQHLINKGTLRTASPDETSGDGSGWGTDVIVHQKKDGVYEEFISADFGAAGRWMITNLSAFLYDTDLAQEAYHSAGRKLEGPKGNTSNPYNTAYWGYTKETGSISTGIYDEYKAYPYMGLLYTWDAASAGKGGNDGTGNIDNPSGVAANNESGMPEGDGTNNTQKRRQGICPKGWHLPSDYEWTELEREIIRNTSRYADMPNIDNGDGTELDKVTQPTPGTSEGGISRGTTHGQAMKAVCPPPKSRRGNPNGNSLSLRKNGFNAMLVNFAQGTSYLPNYGTYTHFWTSSSHNHNNAWDRTLHQTNNKVDWTSSIRYRYCSVRCMKDKD